MEAVESYDRVRSEAASYLKQWRRYRESTPQSFTRNHNSKQERSNSRRGYCGGP